MAEPEDGRGETGAGANGQSVGIQMETEIQPNGASRAGYARSQARSQMGAMRGQVREKAGELKEQATERADELTTRAGGRISGVARALRRAGDELRGEGDEQLASMTQDFAAQIERLGGYLEGEKPGRMIEDLERMAKQNPAFFVGGTFAAGLLFGRFLRSDEPKEEMDVVFEPEGDWSEDGDWSENGDGTTGEWTEASASPTGPDVGVIDEGPYAIGGEHAPREMTPDGQEEDER
jgi:hypothetical protein